MMKRFTFTILGLLLMVGGVFSQEVTTLYLDGGGSVSFSNQVYTDSHVTGAIVTFNENKFNGKHFGLTGSNWVADLKAGETHTFTITLNSGAPAGFHFYIASNRYDDFSNGNARKYVNATIPEGATSVSYSIDATTYPDLLNSEGDNVGPYKWVYIVNEGTQGAQLNISSITRTISTPSSVNAPTITPASGTYDEDEDLTVTITKGEGNAKVIYSVSGATTGNVTDAVFTETSKTLTLTGTGTITVTAIGYDAEDNPSSEVRNTYTTDVPSGKTSIASDNRTLPYTFNNADDNIEFNQNKFNNENIVIGNYVVLDINVANDNTWFCFKKGWGDYPFDQCTSIYSGSKANNCQVNQNDTYWWMKISDQNAVNAFTGNNIQIKGSKIKDTNNYSAMTVNSFSIYKSRAISESENNTISSKQNNVVVELTRSLVADNWNTICLPFALTSAQATQLFGSDYKLAQFTGVSGTTMQFTTTGSFVAGVPYLVKPTIDVSNDSPVVLVDVDITAKTPQTVTHGDYSFVGNFTQKTFTSVDNTTSRFVATENELVTPNENSTLKSLRCYFTVPVAAARSLTFDIDEEGGTTSINTVQGSGVMVNGYYNLNGQRVAKPTKGLFIVNGKKVVIK